MMEPTNAGLVLYTVYAVTAICFLIKMLKALPSDTYTPYKNPYRNYRRPRRARVMPIIGTAIRLGAARIGEKLMVADDGRNPLEW